MHINIAHTPKEEGKKDIANILFSRSQKSLIDLFASTKLLDAATEKGQGANMSMTDLIEKVCQKMTVF